MDKLARRKFFRTGLSKLYLPFYDALCNELGEEWQPYCGVRSFDEQTVLYAKGRTSFPIGPQFIVTRAKAGESAHNYGCATDWAYFDGNDLIWLKREDPKWAVYENAVSKVGLLSGQGFKDPDHNELAIDCDWKHVLLMYKQGGMTQAQQHIEANLTR